MSIFSKKKIDFWGYLLIFGAENTTKNRPFKAKNNTQTLPKLLQNNFEKAKKKTFSNPNR